MHGHTPYKLGHFGSTISRYDVVKACMFRLTEYVQVFRQKKKKYLYPILTSCKPHRVKGPSWQANMQPTRSNRIEIMMYKVAKPQRGEKKGAEEYELARWSCDIDSVRGIRDYIEENPVDPVRCITPKQPSKRRPNRHKKRERKIRKRTNSRSVGEVPLDRVPYRGIYCLRYSSRFRVKSISFWLCTFLRCPARQQSGSLFAGRGCVRLGDCLCRVRISLTCVCLFGQPPGGGIFLLWCLSTIDNLKL